MRRRGNNKTFLEEGTFHTVLYRLKQLKSVSSLSKVPCVLLPGRERWILDCTPESKYVIHIWKMDVG
jgi:hypothetical protein